LLLALLLVGGTLLLLHPSALAAPKREAAAPARAAAQLVQTPLTETISLPIIVVPKPTPLPTPTPTPDPRTLIVAVQAPISGEQAEQGAELVAGAELAVAQRASELLAAGVPLTLVVVDDQGIPAVGALNADALAANPAVRCVVGHMAADVALAALDSYHDGGLPYIASTITDPRLTDAGYPEVYRTAPISDRVGKVAAFHAHRVLQTPKVFIVHDQSPQADAVANQLVAASRVFTEMTVYRGAPYSSASDFPALVAEMVVQTPDVVFFGGSAEEGGALITQMRAANVQANFLGGPALDTPEWLTYAGPAALNTRYITLGAPLWKYPDEATRAFEAAYGARYDRTATRTAAQGYEATMSCLEALRLAAADAPGVPPSRYRVLSALDKIKFVGPLDPVEFTEKGDLLLARYFVETVSSLKPADWGTWYTYFWWTMPP
jgi:branched-chain amino acid transport system substrate-binding protein